MKYKLLKDLPWAKAGTIWEKTNLDSEDLWVTKDDFDVNYKIPLTTFSDWFEEVDEQWRPSTGEDCWLLGEDFEEHMLFGFLEGAEFPERWLKAGRIFRTRELAERAAEQIKALLKEFHKNNP